MNEYHVYIMSSHSKTLYVGVTNNLSRRVYEHKLKQPGSFTAGYNITNLVYFQTTSSIESAIAREKQLKGWLRPNKIALIEESNPAWRDLSGEWVG